MAGRILDGGTSAGGRCEPVPAGGGGRARGPPGRVRGCGRFPFPGERGGGGVRDIAAARAARHHHVLCRSVPPHLTECFTEPASPAPVTRCPVKTARPATLPARSAVTSVTLDLHSTPRPGVRLLGRLPGQHGRSGLPCHLSVRLLRRAHRPGGLRLEGGTQGRARLGGGRHVSPLHPLILLLL